MGILVAISATLACFGIFIKIASLTSQQIQMFDISYYFFKSQGSPGSIMGFKCCLIFCSSREEATRSNCLNQGQIIIKGIESLPSIICIFAPSGRGASRLKFLYPFLIKYSLIQLVFSSIAYFLLLSILFFSSKCLEASFNKTFNSSSFLSCSSFIISSYFCKNINALAYLQYPLVYSLSNFRHTLQSWITFPQFLSCKFICARFACNLALVLAEGHFRLMASEYLAYASFMKNFQFGCYLSRFPACFQGNEFEYIEALCCFSGVLFFLHFAESGQMGVILNIFRDFLHEERMVLKVISDFSHFLGRQVFFRFVVVWVFKNVHIVDCYQDYVILYFNCYQLQKYAINFYFFVCIQRIITRMEHQTLERATDESTHLCLSVRLSNFYIGFIVFQMLLSLTIIVLPLLQHFKSVIASQFLFVQILVVFLLALDLLIRYFSEIEDEFWKRKCNWVDIIILLIISSTAWIDICQQPALMDSQFQSTSASSSPYANQKGEEFGALLVMCRYGVQLYRVLMLVKTTKNIHEQRIYVGMISLQDTCNQSNSTQLNLPQL